MGIAARGFVYDVDTHRLREVLVDEEAAPGTAG